VWYARGVRKLTFAHGEFYHIYNRGVDKRVIFTSPTEYDRFLAYLFILNDAKRKRIDRLFDAKRSLWEAKPPAPLVAIGAYCLMPNHFHLYLTPLVEDGVSKFMQRVQTAYTMYFNQKHRRSGALLQGTFKAQHASDDAYAKYLFSYIHLNPAKLKDAKWKERNVKDLKKLREFVRAYPYSSIAEYQSGSPRITDPSKFPNYLREQTDVASHIDVWLTRAEDWEV